MDTLATVNVSAAAALDWKAGQRAGIKVRFLKTPLMFTVDSSMSQRIAFAPMTFEEGGKRKLTLELTEEQAALFEKLEAGLKEHADPTAVWTSALRHTAYGHQLSCRLSDKVQYYDGAKQPCSDPVEWKGLSCNACLRVATLWAQRASQGFAVELVALQYEAGEAPTLANPFA
jgi:hypothetical protein